MPVYDYICKTCGASSSDTSPSAERDCTQCGGQLRRNWKSVNVNTVNQRQARG